jgi:hypothetical protein
MFTKYNIWIVFNTYGYIFCLRAGITNALIYQARRKKGGYKVKEKF